jgi:hypothetical protein
VALVRRTLLLLRRNISFEDFYLARGVMRPCRISGKYQDRHCNHDSLYIVSIEMIGKIMGGRSGGRKKGAKNVSTLWREAQASIGDGGLVVDVADPLEAIEQIMRYFYRLGMEEAKAPVELVQKCFQKALYAASLAAPYRHARLSAVKHLEQTGTIDGISSNATPEELRTEIAKRIALLRDKGYVDLDALPAPPQDDVQRGDETPTEDESAS